MNNRGSTPLGFTSPFVEPPYNFNDLRQQSRKQYIQFTHKPQTGIDTYVSPRPASIQPSFPFLQQYSYRQYENPFSNSFFREELERKGNNTVNAYKPLSFMPPSEPQYRQSRAPDYGTIRRENSISHEPDGHMNPFGTLREKVMKNDNAPQLNRMKSDISKVGTERNFGSAVTERGDLNSKDRVNTRYSEQISQIRQHSERANSKQQQQTSVFSRVDRPINSENELINTLKRQINRLTGQISKKDIQHQKEIQKKSMELELKQEAMRQLNGRLGVTIDLNKHLKTKLNDQISKLKQKQVQKEVLRKDKSHYEEEIGKLKEINKGLLTQQRISNAVSNDYGQREKNLKQELERSHQKIQYLEKQSKIMSQKLGQNEKNIQKLNHQVFLQDQEIKKILAQLQLKSIKIQQTQDLLESVQFERKQIEVECKTLNGYIFSLRKKNQSLELEATQKSKLITKKDEDLLDIQSKMYLEQKIQLQMRQKMIQNQNLYKEIILQNQTNIQNLTKQNLRKNVEIEEIHKKLLDQKERKNNDIISQVQRMLANQEKLKRESKQQKEKHQFQLGCLKSTIMILEKELDGKDKQVSQLKNQFQQEIEKWKSRQIQLLGIIYTKNKQQNEINPAFQSEISNLKIYPKTNKQSKKENQIQSLKVQDKEVKKQISDLRNEIDNLKEKEIENAEFIVKMEQIMNKQDQLHKIEIKQREGPYQLRINDLEKQIASFKQTLPILTIQTEKKEELLHPIIPVCNPLEVVVRDLQRELGKIKVINSDLTKQNKRLNTIIGNLNCKSWQMQKSLVALNDLVIRRGIQNLNEKYENLVEFQS